jgi:hypothetical protein
MGMFKQFKDLKAAVHEAPGLIVGARDLAAQAQAFGAAQAGQFGVADVHFGGTVTPAELEPIAGISLERYAQLSKTLGERRLQGTAFVSLIEAHGMREADWQTAYDGWNARMKTNNALSMEFAALYQQTAAL